MQVVTCRQRKALGRARRDVEDEPVLMPRAVETGIAGAPRSASRPVIACPAAGVTEIRV
jgi:hypothetical protein